MGWTSKPVRVVEIPEPVPEALPWPERVPEAEPERESEPVPVRQA